MLKAILYLLLWKSILVRRFCKRFLTDDFVVKHFLMGTLNNKPSALALINSALKLPLSIFQSANDK